MGAIICIEVVSIICNEEALSLVSEECGGQEVDGEPLAGDAWFGVDPVVDSQKKATAGGSLCKKGDKDLMRGRW